VKLMVLVSRLFIWKEASVGIWVEIYIESKFTKLSREVSVGPEMICCLPTGSFGRRYTTSALVYFEPKIDGIFFSRKTLSAIGDNFNQGLGTCSPNVNVKFWVL